MAQNSHAGSEATLSLSGYTGHRAGSYRSSIVTPLVPEHTTPVAAMIDEATLYSSFNSQMQTHGFVTRVLGTTSPLGDIAAAMKSGDYGAMQQVEQEMVDMAKVEVAEHREENLGMHRHGFKPLGLNA